MAALNENLGFLRVKSAKVLTSKIVELLAKKERERKEARENEEDFQEETERDYEKEYEKKKKNIIGKRILKSKECFSRLLTKKNIFVSNFSSVMPNLSSKASSIMREKDNPFHQSFSEDSVSKSQGSIHYGFEQNNQHKEDSSNAQSPYFGAQYDNSAYSDEMPLVVPATSHLKKSIAKVDDSEIEMRAFQSIDNTMKKELKNGILTTDTIHNNSYKSTDQSHQKSVEEIGLKGSKKAWESHQTNYWDNQAPFKSNSNVKD